MVECREGYLIPEEIEQISKEEYNEYNIKSELFEPLVCESFENMCGLVKKVFEVKDEELFEVNPLFVEVWRKHKAKKINFELFSFDIEIRIKRKEKQDIVIRTLNDKCGLENKDYFGTSKKVVEIYNKKSLSLAKNFASEYKKQFSEDIFLVKKY